MVSVYPVIKIWQLNENSEQLDLASGGDYWTGFNPRFNDLRLICGQWRTTMQKRND
jgi:hypothetical protein